VGLAGLIFIQLLTFYLGIVLTPLFLFLIPVLIVSVFWLIRHPEFTLLLIGFTSIIKGFLQEQVLIFETLDLTVLLIALLWLGMARIFISGEWRFPELARGLLLLFALFSGVVMLSGLYTPSPESGGLKISRFLVFASSMFVAPFVLLNTQADSARMLKYFKILSALILCAMLVNLLIIVTSGGLVTYLVRASLLGANPIAVSRSLAVIAAMVTVIGIRQSGWRRYTSLLLLALILLAIVSTGSRGPLISFFAGIAVFTLMFESAVYRSRLFMVGGVSIIIVVSLLLVLPESLTTRFLQITQGDIIVTAGGVERVSTIATRLNFWEMSLQQWVDSVFSFFFGIGAGGFSSLFIWRDFRWYPHNIFIEVLVEQGLVGLVLIGLMIVFAVRLLLKARYQGIISENSSVWIASMIVIFFSAQVSGDLNDNRILLMFLAIALSSLHLDGLFMNKRGSRLLA
tara:strand:- start:1118 stop:2488 length:1371 start_codon:yes stop_codon:yes gene_type:complete